MNYKLDLKASFTGLKAKPVILFTLVAAVHILWLLYTIWCVVQEPGRIEWINLTWMLAYTTFWIAAARYKRWGAWGYMALTAVNILLFYYTKTAVARIDYVSSIFLLDILFSFFLLLYYKHLR